MKSSLRNVFTLEFQSWREEIVHTIIKRVFLFYIEGCFAYSNQDIYRQSLVLTKYKTTVSKGWP